MPKPSTYLIRALLALALPFASFAATPAAITAVSGSGQWTTVSTAYTNHLAALVTDASNNPVSGVLVDFSGPGIVSTSSSTNANGQVSVPVTATSSPGGDTVTASIDGSPQIMTTFGLMAGAASTCAQTNVVTSTADSNAVGTLREAVFDLCPGGTVDLSQLPNNSTITLSSRIYLSQDITLKGPTNGNTVTISGNNATRLFFLESGNVTVTNLTLANGLGQGGNSYYGGGAAGMGGGIFQNGGALTMTNVVMSGNRASGGSGDVTNGDPFGGGGFGGDAPGKTGASGGDLGGAGGANNSSSSGGPGGDGAGGGFGGGMGGFGGGGAGNTAPSNTGGAGGFGGGGGAAPTGGGGGWGAGSAGYEAGVGYFAAGGAGFGGAIFTRAGSLTLTSVAFNDNSATGGGSGGGLANGQAKGGALFIYSGTYARLIDVTFTGSVAANAGQPGIGASATPYTNGQPCPGLDTADICGNAATITSPDPVQTAYTGSAFNTLQILVEYDGAAPPDGTGVTFTAPSSGASGTFNNAFTTISSGIATAGFTANGITGTYQVTATVAGYGTQTFTLTNQCGSVPVTNNSDSRPGSLRAAVLAACPGGTIDLTILAGETITLQSRLYISQDLTIQGPANETVTIDGGSATRLFFIQSGNVKMTNLILAHGLGQGGNGGLGGAAAGMGGAIFQNGGNLTLTNVGFLGNQAVGGSTNSSSNSDGGGGFGGSAPPGLVGGSGGDLGGAGGSVDGSNGGPGAGGGGGLSSATGGAGGFGGGGGYSPNVGGTGGFGGGGGSGTNGRAGGFGGGTGASSTNKPNGGGGAGFGGAIFEFSGTLTLNSVSFNGNTSTGGIGSQNGQAKGGALFVYYGATANLNNVTFTGDTAADAGSNASGNSPTPYYYGSVCPGFDTTDICGLVNFGFGSVNIGQTVTQTIPVNLNTTGQAYPPIALTDGSMNLDYSLVSTTCPMYVASLPLLCTVTMRFTPQYAGPRPGSVFIYNGAGPITSTILLNGIGVGPQIAFGPGVQSTLSSGFGSPVGVVVNGAGNVFVADTSAGKIYEFPAGGGSAIAAIPAVSPTGVALDGAGYIFFTVQSTSSVYKLKQGSYQPIAIGSGFENPLGIAVDAAGNVYVADQGLHQVVEIPASGAPQTTVGSGFLSPTAVAVDATGNVYVGDAGTQQVYKVPANGGPQTQVGGLFSSPPTGLAVDAAGNVYVAVAGAQVYKVPSDGSPQFTLGSGFSMPSGVAVDAAGDLFVTDSGTHAAYELNLSQPPTLTFPNTNVTSTSPAQSVTIENIGNASLLESALTIGTNFTQVAGSGNPADCTASTTLAQGASCNLSISFAPTTGGPLTGSATLTNNNLNVSGATQSINLGGTGVATTFSVTIATSPSGLSFTLDGTTYTAPQTLLLKSGNHSLATTSPQSLGAGSQAVFSSWSDGGALSHSITVISSPLSITGSFTTQYQLTTTAGTGGTVSPTSGTYYNSGTVVPISATPSVGYYFIGWTGPAASASSASTTVAMSAPESVTANFAAQTAQTITFNPIATQLNGGVLTLSATASSSLTVSYMSDTLGICTVSGSVATMIATGTCEITASQAGNGTTIAAATPVPQSFMVVAANMAIVSQTLGPIRNNYTGFVGMEFTVGPTPTTVYSLGRFIAPGNNQTHTVKLVQANGTDVPGGAVSVNTATGTSGQYEYAALASPVTLLANTSYFLVSMETAGGDSWYNYGPVTPSADTMVLGPTYVDNFGHYVPVTTLAGNSYVPVNFLFAAPITTLSVSITSPAPSVTLSGTSPVTVATTGAVASLQIKVDGVNVGSSVAVSVNQGPNYTISLNTTTILNGTHTLVVVASDAQSDMVSSAGVSITISNPVGVSSSFVVAETPGAARNNYSGFVGMDIKIGSTPVVVTSLGRWVIAGNSGTHTVKLMNSNGTDVAGGSVSLSLVGAMPGEFTYASLPAAVTLQAGATYYLVSQETTGGDYWYDIGSVTTTVVGSVAGPVYTDGFGNYVPVGGYAGESYVPVSFQYGSTVSVISATITSPQTGALVSGSAVPVTVTTTGPVTSLQLQVNGVNSGSAVSASPLTFNTTGLANGPYTLTVVASGGGSTADSPGVTVTVDNGGANPKSFIASETASTLRNNYSGGVGMEITVGSTALTVSSLGRFMSPDNTGTHTLMLVQANGTPVTGGSTNVNMTGGTVGQFVYASLAVPVTLAANTTYYLVSQETAGGDQWYNLELVTDIGVAQILGPTYTNGQGNYVTVSGYPGYSYVPLSFLYQ